MILRHIFSIPGIPSGSVSISSGFLNFWPISEGSFQDSLHIFESSAGFFFRILFQRIHFGDLFWGIVFSLPKILSGLLTHPRFPFQDPVQDFKTGFFHIRGIFFRWPFLEGSFFTGLFLYLRPRTLSGFSTHPQIPYRNPLQDFKTKNFFPYAWDSFSVDPYQWPLIFEGLLPSCRIVLREIPGVLAASVDFWLPWQRCKTNKSNGISHVIAFLSDGIFWPFSEIVLQDRLKDCLFFCCWSAVGCVPELVRLTAGFFCRIVSVDCKVAHFLLLRLRVFPFQDPFRDSVRLFGILYQWWGIFQDFSGFPSPFHFLRFVGILWGGGRNFQDFLVKFVDFSGLF